MFSIQELFSTERFHHDALNTGNNCWFSHDVTKIQTTKLSSLLIFYFHGVLEQLKSKDLQEVTGRTSSPALNLGKPFSYICSIEENSLGDLTV